MGGWGSGRTSTFSAKNTVEDYRAIDVRRWNREGLLAPGHAFSWQWSRNGKKVASIQCLSESNHVTLSYSNRKRGDDDWKHENYRVNLDWTDCHLGGQRPWFLCPAFGCGRRVALLYGGVIFACRRCRQLVYSSQRETLDSRLLRRADKIRDRLNWEPGVLNVNGWKPKGMHWKTYDALSRKHDALVKTSLNRLALKLPKRLG